MTEVRRVALLMGQDVSFFREVIRGIRDYAMEKNWAFNNGPFSAETVQYCRAWKPHGIIAHLSERELAKKTLRISVPVIDIACAFSNLKVPVVDVDHHAVGVMAAEHFLERGFRHFGFYGDSQTWYSQIREAAFCERLATDSRNTISSCYADRFCYPKRQSVWEITDKDARKWLQGLPKPVAILAVDDMPARHLSDICRLCGIKVPDEVALLGIDNDDMECHFAIPPLSSIAIPSQQIGWDTARLLEQMMGGKSPSSHALFHPPIGVVVRQSTDVFAIEDQDVAAALAFIRNHLLEEIRIASIAYEIGIARRTLETKFREFLGRSILEEIHRMRVETAKRLLIETDLPMPAIAKRSGFANAQRLTIVFGRVTGITPTDYRHQRKIGK